MSVVVFPDDGPSYTLHEPTPACGPAICDNCVHVRYGQGPGGSFIEKRYAEHWTCAAVPDKVNRPAGVDPITGETVPAQVTRIRCAVKNKRGTCSDFRSPKQSRTLAADAPPQDREPWKLAPEHLIFSAMLVARVGHVARRCPCDGVIGLRASRDPSKVITTPSRCDAELIRRGIFEMVKMLMKDLLSPATVQINVMSHIGFIE